MREGRAGEERRERENITALPLSCFAVSDYWKAGILNELTEPSEEVSITPKFIFASVIHGYNYNCCFLAAFILFNITWLLHLLMIFFARRVLYTHCDHSLCCKVAV